MYLRRASRLKNPDPSRVTLVDGDALDSAKLKSAMEGQDVVYANLAGDMKAAAEHIIDAMHGKPEVSYQLTQKGEPFRGHDVTLDSLSDLITKLATTPGLHVRESLGVSTP